MDVQLQLLGEVRVRAGAAWHLPPADKRLGLLGYLACAGTWVDRDRLAWLFWPDVPSSRARTNLRGLLARSRRAPYADDLEAEPSRVRWLVDCDAREFRVAVANGAWGEAVRIYGGAFFGCAPLDDVGELGVWIDEERGRLRADYRRAALAFAATMGATGPDTGLAIAALDVLLDDDPFDEEVARHAIAARAAVGRRDEALRLAEVLRRRLREELETAPSEETERLVATLERNAPVGGAGGVAARAVAAMTPFVGRHAERRELAERLTQEPCRLLTVTGPGGVGKTRLAQQVAQEVAGHFRDGAYVVSVGSARSTQDVAIAITDALELRLTADEAAERGVIHALTGFQALLVLDDLDGALVAAGWLAELLSACPGTTLLATTRQRLDLPGEWLVRLAGLERPAPDPDPEAARGADAVRLFLDTAMRVEPRFALGKEELPAVLRICQSVEGLPLALELAASWVRALPVQDLAVELEVGSDLLRRTSHGGQDRHHSVRAAFEHSWARLSEDEAEVFAALAVFRGGFRREAAAAVAGAAIPTLAALVDKSLLRLARDGRYERHSLLSRFAREKLEERPRLERRARVRHAAYFADWLEEAARRFEFTGDVAIGRSTAAAYDDLTAVLEEAVEAANTELAARICASLGWFWIWRGRAREGRAWLERVRALPFPPDGLTEASVLQLASVMSVTTGEYEEARTLAARAMEKAREHGDVALMAESLNDLGFISSQLGDVDAAQAYFEEGLTVADEADHPGVRMILWVNSSACAVRSGDEGRARRHLERAQALAAELGNGKVMGLVHLHRARLERQLGDRRAASVEFDRADALLRTAGHADLVARVELHLALSCLADGEPASAAPLLDACLVSWWEAGTTGRVPDVLRATAALSARVGRSNVAVLLWRAAEELAPGPASMLLPSERAVLTAAVHGAPVTTSERADEGAALVASGGATAAIAFAREVLAQVARA